MLTFGILSVVNPMPLPLKCIDTRLDPFRFELSAAPSFVLVAFDFVSFDELT